MHGLNIATLAYQAIQTLIQSLIIVAIALAAGARFPGGVAGVSARWSGDEAVDPVQILEPPPPIRVFPGTR